MLAGLFVVAGLLSILGPALALKKKARVFRDLPVLAVVKETLARLERTQNGVATVPALVTRAQVAVAATRRAQREVTILAESFTWAIRRAFGRSGGGPAV